MNISSKQTKLTKLKGAEKVNTNNKLNNPVDKTKATKPEKVTEAKIKKMKLPFFRKLHIRPTYLVLGLVATMLTVFFARVAFWEHNYLSAKEGTERDVAVIEVNEGNSEDVDNTEPTEQQIVEYIVAPDKPRYLTIPYLGIRNARIVEIGLKGQGQMATPYNIYDVGWYTGTGSVLPGQKGVSILNAHGGDLGNGIFKTLPKLPVGETIIVEMGDGRKFTYKVTESVTKALGEEADRYMSTAFTPLNSTGNTLSLITCTGEWWDRQQTYSQRLFVRAIMQ